MYSALNLIATTFAGLDSWKQKLKIIVMLVTVSYCTKIITVQ